MTFSNELLLAGAGPGLRPRPPRPALRSGPQRLGAALAVEPAPALQRGLRPDPELGHGVGLRHPAVDHGRRRGDPLLECVPGLFPAHGQQRLASERPVYPLPFSHGLAGDGQGLGRRLAADAGVEELDGPPPGLQVVLHPEVYTHGKPPISRCPRNGRQFTVPFVVVLRCRFTRANLWRRCGGVLCHQKVNHGELYWFQQRSRQ